MDGYPGSMGTAPPPPPPPPPAPTRPRAPWWAIVLMLAAAATVVVAVLIAAGREGPTTTMAVSTTSTTGPGTTTSTIAPTTSLATTTTLLPTTSSTSTTSTTLPSRLYGRPALEYFQEIAGEAEFGGSGGTLHRWVEDLRIAVYGSPTDRDRRTLDTVVEELNELIDTVELTQMQTDPNVEIHFVPVDDFPTIEPNYVEGNLGYVYIWWDADGQVYRARILISTTGVTPAERAHLIREELTQSLGLLNDSWLYPDSIFYQGWTDTNRYARLDRLAIEMLYRPELSVGMTIEQAVSVLASLRNG